METKPSWASSWNLTPCGLYYEGFVDDYNTVLSQHSIATVSTYGVRKSRVNGITGTHAGDTLPSSSTDPNENAKKNTTDSNENAQKNEINEKMRIYWHKKEGRKTIQFNNTPFSVMETKTYDCQFGPKYFKQKPPKRKHLWLQGTRKIDCKAHIEVKAFSLYPEFALSMAETEGLSKWKIRCLQEEKIKIIREKINANEQIKVEMKYFVSLPNEEAHSGHPTNQEGIFAQKLHPQISQKIVEMVRAGITDTAEVKRALRYHVDHQLSKELGEKPKFGDRAFYPLNSDIRNHVSRAKRALELSKYDQENLRLKIEEWKAASPQSSFFFRPYHSKPEIGENDEENDEEHNEEKLLYVHQEKWQKELLIRYGNTVTLMDATYKTTKYSIPLFFICVKTNVSYVVVAEFIIQSESDAYIYEALSIIKGWNPEWEPKFYLTDYSDAEIAAIKRLFPSTQLYLCDFHREQAWERWTKDRKHGLSEEQGRMLLDLLRDCANAPPNKMEPQDSYYKHAVAQLQASEIWQSNQDVQQWLKNKWLCCPKMWARAYRDQIYHAAINTTNGVESQNKLLKYSYLPRKRNIMLSHLVTILYEQFIPESHQKYLYLNYQMTDTYRRYNDFVPEYLRGRPRQIIVHCLERKSSSRKYTEEDIQTEDTIHGTFTLQGNGQLHTINFGCISGIPTCTCLDWQKWHIPCKHFFFIFRVRKEWGWEALPETYKQSAHLSMHSSDTGISEQINPTLNTAENEPSTETDVTDRDESNPSAMDSIQTKKVSVTQDLRNQRQAIRVVLDEIKTLSFDMETVDSMKALLKDLRSLQEKYDQGLQKSEGIIVRPTTSCTNATEKALQLKRKYKQMRLQAAKYNSLPEKQRGRPRLNAVYRNRVGKKAATKREELRLVSTQVKELQSQGTTKLSGQKRVRGRCGDCTGCNTPNCRDCPECQDMKCYGGPGIKKKACRNRKCITVLPTNVKKQQLPLRNKENINENSSVNTELPKEELLKIIATPNYILSPGITIPESLTPVSAPPSKLTNVDDFLLAANRSLNVILGDGNCMFRALSHQLYGTQEYHLEIRNILVNVIEANTELYKPYWIEDLPWGKVSFDEHLTQLKRPGSWGTQLELMVFSDCFNLAVYVCSKNLSGIIRWECKGSPKYPNRIAFSSPRPSRPTPLPFTQAHAELVHHSGHYDSVIPRQRGTKLLPPIIFHRNSDYVVNIR